MPNAVAEVRPTGGDVLRRIRPVQGWAGLGQFLGVSAQLGLLLMLIYLLKIEQAAGFLRILPLVFAGFLVHAALPLRYRLPFFLLLSLAAIGVVLGLGPGAVLVALGLALVGLCHLPVAFSTRVVLLLVAGGALAALRSGWAPVPLAALPTLAGLPALVLPVLGSMFMFRLIIYLYDLRHEERERATGMAGAARAGAPASVWTRLSYFFLLPNVCFLLFPVVDYRTFRRSYYDSRPNEIYQRGVWWICLGLMHLLLYRLVYHYLVPSPEEVQGLGGVVRFMTASYLIYLRVVGLFHLIVGLLCLFGFNLPPAHRFFFLASGFTDFWRRARIDWKDFVVKVFYYPALVPAQRRWGTTPAMVLATVAVFVVTWLLHSYQWFWLRGDFPLSRADAVFWTVFGGCVLVNSLLEAKRGRKRARNWALGPAVVRAIKVLGMFIFLCFLWSYWSSPSFGAWLGLVSAAGDSGPAAYALLLGALAAAVGMGVLAQFVAARMAPAKVAGRAPARVPAPAPFVWRPIAVGAVVGLLLLVEIPAARGSFGAPAAELASRLSTNELNVTDQEREDRSYYEVLLDTPRSTLALAAVGMGPADEVGSSKEAATGTIDTVTTPPAAESMKPVERSRQYIADSVRHMEWRRTQAASGRGPAVGRRVREYEAYTSDLRLWENIPSFDASLKGARFYTNQWGMRDKAYSLAPPPRTYRIALVGGSMTVGAGVPLEETMETLVEDRLNREGPGAPERGYEILNFSVGGYGIMQNVAVVDQKIFAFAPNAVLVSVFSVEGPRMTNYLTKIIRNKIAIPYPYVQRKLRDAGVEATMQDSELRRRIGPIAEDLVRWSYAHILEVGRRQGVRVIGVVLPEPIPKVGRDIDQAAQLAAASGLSLLDLRDVYQGYGVDSLKLPGRDPHWSAAGHKLIADRLYEMLRANDARALKLGFRTPMESRKPPSPVGPPSDDAALDNDALLGSPGRPSAPFIRLTNDNLIHELVPSFTGRFKEAPLLTNRWGMRDKEYELKPPARTYRIALLGSSFTMGGGVPAEQTIESLLEDRLNREGPGAPDRHYEILNFSVMRYGVLQHLIVTEKKAFTFEPNGVLVVIHAVERLRMINHLLSLLRQGVAIEYPYLRQKLQEAGVRPDMEETELRRRLATIALDLVSWSYRHIAEICRARHVPVVGIVFREPRAVSEKELAAVAGSASAAGIPLVDLQGVYYGRSLSSLRLPRDPHLNALGHQVVADRLYEVLRANDARALKLGFGSGAKSGQTAPPARQPSADAALNDEPPFGGPDRRSAPFLRLTDNLLAHELVPSFTGSFKGTSFHTNRWGMRDKEYELKPPPGTYRIALLGSSFTFGWGVPVEQTIEWLLEDRLNREGPGAPARHYEILNFSVMGYGVLQHLFVTERKAFTFEPNAVLVVIHSVERSRLIKYLVASLRQGVVIEYPYLRQKLQEAGVGPAMDEMELRRRLAPFAPDLVRWSYQRVAEICRAHRVPVVGIIFPEPRKGTEEDFAAVAGLASAAGIPLVDLRGVYDGRTLRSFKLPGDAHLNALGHQVVADRFYELLRANDARALQLGFADRQ